MLLKRIGYLFALALALSLAWWAFTHIRFVEGGSAKAGGTGRSEAAIGDNAAAPRESVIDYTRLDRRLRLLAAGDGMVGLAVGVVENGEIRFLKGYGVTEAGTENPVTPNTVFRWASLSKGVASDMVALLAGENRLSLFEPVNRYSTSLRLPAGNEARATVADLLSHQLGLFSHASDSKLEDGQDAKYLRSTLALLNAICSPGQCHAYQNVAYDAATEVVERVTGQSYRDTVRDRLFGPLGMNSASMTMAGLTASQSWARPHVGGRNSRSVELTDSYYRVPAAGGVNSSIKDLAIWMRAQMGVEPGVLTPAVLAAVQTPRVNTPGENGRRRNYRERIGQARYGLGWRIFDYAGRKVVGHRGGVRGYRSLILFDPERRSGVVAMWNSSVSRPNGLEYEVMDMVYRLPFRDWMEIAEPLPGAAPDPPLTETLIEGGTGG